MHTPGPEVCFARPSGTSRLKAGQVVGCFLMLEHLGYGKNGRNSIWLVKCNSCGHVSRMFTNRLHADRTNCPQCRRVTEMPEHGIWKSMRSRCSNLNDPAYRHYGARGILVCDEWQTFQAFLRDMGPRPSSKHSLDRINNDGNYEPSNCRWATRRQQNRNTRANKWYEVNGVRMIASDWASVCGISKQGMLQRFRRLSPEDAIRPYEQARRLTGLQSN